MRLYVLQVHTSVFNSSQAAACADPLACISAQQSRPYLGPQKGALDLCNT